MGLQELKKKVGALVREDEVYQSSDLGGVAICFRCRGTIITSCFQRWRSWC